MSPFAKTLLVAPLTLLIGVALSAAICLHKPKPAPVTTPSLTERKDPPRVIAVRCTKGREWPRCYLQGAHR